jgi:hypothetical protein
MDFGIFTMFSVHEDGTQFQTFQEWFDLVQVAEALLPLYPTRSGLPVDVSQL